MLLLVVGFHKYPGILGFRGFTSSFEITSGGFPWVSGCLWISMGIRVSAWELPVGQYWILRCQHGAFHWEGQFHPPWGLIAGIKGGRGCGGVGEQNENWRAGVENLRGQCLGGKESG